MGTWGHLVGTWEISGHIRWHTAIKVAPALIFVRGHCGRDGDGDVFACPDSVSTGTMRSELPTSLLPQRHLRAEYESCGAPAANLLYKQEVLQRNLK